MAMNNGKVKKPLLSLHSGLSTTLFFVVIFTAPALLLLHTPTISLYTAGTSSKAAAWSGDLRGVEFSWNRLEFSGGKPPLRTLRIAVFSWKWPTSATPGSMERHAHTLHTVLARRGHHVHVFTSSPLEPVNAPGNSDPSPVIHWHEGEPGRWRYNKAWEQFEEENRKEAFDMIHSESVAFPHHVARDIPMMAVVRCEREVERVGLLKRRGCRREGV